ncbi:hypothetical protein [Natronomonas amylolytica]|uniref:hypothetical protein n=1 Tax=Natronomonas amylolytica TaxID=3108498 RepID=UPI00300B7E1F
MSDGIRRLPAFTALSGQAVLDGHRKGASIQLDETYFAGQIRALQADEFPPGERRLAALRDSRETYESIDVEVESLTEQHLWDASRRFRRRLRTVPEVAHLDRHFPGHCFVVPEWLRTDNRLHYGARVYLFREDDAPTPETVMQENIAAVVADSFGDFERYQGRLHGYPDCCIDFYQDRSPDSPAPEWQAIAPFADRIDEDALGAGPAGSIDDVVPAFPDTEAEYAFFAREFFPEPGCETARTKGRAVYDTLAAVVDERLVEDYFKLTFGFNYLVAQAVHTGGNRRPTPGDLGREDLLFYAPLGELTTLPRYS